MNNLSIGKIMDMNSSIDVPSTLEMLCVLCVELVNLSWLIWELTPFFSLFVWYPLCTLNNLPGSVAESHRVGQLLHTAVLKAV